MNLTRVVECRKHFFSPLSPSDCGISSAKVFKITKAQRFQTHFKSAFFIIMIPGKEGRKKGKRLVMLSSLHTPNICTSSIPSYLPAKKSIFSPAWNVYVWHFCVKVWSDLVCCRLLLTRRGSCEQLKNPVNAQPRSIKAELGLARACCRERVAQVTCARASHSPSEGHVACSLVRPHASRYVACLFMWVWFGFVCLF